MACAVSLVFTGSLQRPIRIEETSSPPVLQNLKTTGMRGLLYLYPQGSHSRTPLSEFTIYSDSSFAPAGRESQTGPVYVPRLWIC